MKTMERELIPTITAAEAARLLGFATKQSIYDLVRGHELTAFINRGGGWETLVPESQEAQNIPSNTTRYFDRDQVVGWGDEHPVAEQAPPPRAYTEELRSQVLQVARELMITQLPPDHDLEQEQLPLHELAALVDGLVRKEVLRVMNARHGTSLNSYRFYQKVAHILNDAQIPFSAKYKNVARRRTRSHASK